MTIPSKNYPKPMYWFSEEFYTFLSSNMEDDVNSLSGYFYVSDTSQKNSSAIYYNIEDGFITEFAPTRPDGNWTGNVVYVKSHDGRKGKATVKAAFTYVFFLRTCTHRKVSILLRFTQVVIVFTNPN